MELKVSGGESSSTLWNRESNTTDHAITKREVIRASKEGRAHIHTPVPAYAGWEESFPPPRSGCRSGRTAGKERSSLPPCLASSAAAASPLLRGIRGAELPRCCLFCKTWKIIAFMYKYTERFCVCIRVRVCVQYFKLSGTLI